MLSACFEEEEQPLGGESVQQEGQYQVAPLAPGREGPWLEMGDSETPLAFLARQSGEAEALLAPGLAAASREYRESERMIANRLLALWLEAGGEPGRDPGLASLLTAFSQGGGGAEQSIGPVIQQYRMLRGQGLTHEAALGQSLRPDAGQEAGHESGRAPDQPAGQDDAP